MTVLVAFVVKNLWKGHNVLKYTCRRCAKVKKYLTLPLSLYFSLFVQVILVLQAGEIFVELHALNYTLFYKQHFDKQRLQAEICKKLIKS